MAVSASRPPETYISTFSGCGALDIAIGRVFPIAKCLVYVENEVTAALRLAARMEEGRLHSAPIWSDMATFPGGMFRGRADMVTGGFPCTDLSVAGKREGIHGARSGLFFRLLDVIRTVGPRYVFLENAAGIYVGRSLDEVHGALAALGFAAEWGSLSAGAIGASHGRDRWWCLAWDRRQVADAHGDERHTNGREPYARTNGWHHAGGCSSALGDPERQGLALGRGIGRDVLRQQPTTERTGPAVGHPECDGSERRRRSVNLASPCSHAQREAQERERGWDTDRDSGGRVDGLPEHPPWPDDPAWVDIIARRSDLAPATESVLRRMVDVGATDDRLDVCLCSRNDRIRLIGNAVDTRAAEWALRLLWHRAFGEWP